MQNRDYLISVIIPVYNMVKYLDRCMDSVLRAQIDDMQIILVDDGSTDESPEICDRYAQEHSNVLVVHRENGGISAARNSGMAVAKGAYIFFLDSDDRVHEDAFKKFAEFINAKDFAPDVVLCDAEFVHNDTDRRIPMTLKLDPSEMDGISGEEAIGKILRAVPNFEWYCWRYFYRRAYLESAGHIFLEGRCYEDVKWTPQVLTPAERVCYLPALSVLYTWCRPNSIVNTVSFKKAMDKLFICDDACRFAQEKISDPEIARQLLTGHAELYMSAVRDYCAGLEELYKPLKEYAYLLQHSRSKVGKLMRRSTKLFGFRIGSWITKLALKVLR